MLMEFRFVFQKNFSSKCCSRHVECSCDNMAEKVVPQRPSKNHFKTLLLSWNFLPQIFFLDQEKNFCAFWQPFSKFFDQNFSARFSDFFIFKYFFAKFSFWRSHTNFEVFADDFGQSMNFFPAKLKSVINLFLLKTFHYTRIQQFWQTCPETLAKKRKKNSLEVWK